MTSSSRAVGRSETTKQRSPTPPTSMNRSVTCRSFTWLTRISSPLSTRRSAVVSAGNNPIPRRANPHHHRPLTPRSVTQERRCYLHHSRHDGTVSKHPSPYDTLGIPAHSSSDRVKRAFVKLALQTHPDQKGGSTEAFLRVRRAFERIRRGGNDHDDDGGGGPPGWSAEEIRRWWQKETGEFLSFHMNESTRQEVIRAYHTMAPSGKDKGGYWEMARQLAEREATRKQQHGGRQPPPAEEDRPVAKLETSSSVVKRRRRKR